MTRTSGQNKARQRDCLEYRVSVDEECELKKWLPSDVKAEFKGKADFGSQCHHIFGRGRSEEFEYSCNLILISSPAHDWVESHSIKGTILCLYAKWKKFLADEKRIKAAGREMPDAKYLDWNVDVCNRLVRPWSSLAGKVSTLIETVDHRFYAELGLELLQEIENDDLEI